MLIEMGYLNLEAVRQAQMELLACCLHAECMLSAG